MPISLVPFFLPILSKFKILLKSSTIQSNSLILINLK